MTMKIAISLPDEQVEAIKRAVNEGRARSVSGFISSAIARAEHENGLIELLDSLDDKLGPPGRDHMEWADKELGL